MQLHQYSISSKANLPSFTLTRVYKNLRGSIKVVDHTPHHPKVEGSSPVATTGTGREIGVKMLSVSNPFCHILSLCPLRQRDSNPQPRDAVASVLPPRYCPWPRPDELKNLMQPQFLQLLKVET